MYICTYICIPYTVVVILCTSLQLLIIIAQSYGTDPSKLYYNNMEGYGLAHRLKGNLIVLFQCGPSAGVTCNSSQLIGDTDSSNSNAALKGWGVRRFQPESFWQLLTGGLVKQLAEALGHKQTATFPLSKLLWFTSCLFQSTELRMYMFSKIIDTNQLCVCVCGGGGGGLCTRTHTALLVHVH